MDAGKLIVFDFDGTLCDSRWLAVEAIQTYAQKKKIQKLSKIETSKWETASAKELFHLAKLNPVEILKIADALRSHFVERAAELKLFEGVEEAISKLAQNHTLGILSSNHQNVLQKVVATLPFEFLKTNRNIFGKASSLTKIRKSYAGAHCLYIGDEVRDMKAARKAGFEAIGVSWGGDEEAELLEAGASRVIKRPQDIALNFS